MILMLILYRIGGYIITTFKKIQIVCLQMENNAHMEQEQQVTWIKLNIELELLKVFSIFKWFLIINKAKSKHTAFYPFKGYWNFPWAWTDAKKKKVVLILKKDLTTTNKKCFIQMLILHKIDYSVLQWVILTITLKNMTADNVAQSLFPKRGNNREISPKQKCSNL